MNDWIYLGAVLFGAFSLLIEADRNYRTTLSNHPFPYHAILEKVELENLCTPREWMSGFLFYSLLYLLTYVIILSSTELFLLVRNANIAELQVGAHTTFVGPLSDPMELSGTAYGKPIFVSAFLIAFLSMGAMKPVETYMRALAHRLAGVPRGVYKVLERLQTVEYLKLNAKYPSPLLKKFTRLSEQESYKDVSDQYTTDIRTQLCTIDCLSPSVTAGFSRLHFPLTHFDAFKEVPMQLAKEIEEVDKLIDRLKPTETSLKALHEHAVLASNSAKAVFAVFYVRNNHAIKNADPKSPIAKIENLIARGYRTELNSFAMSMFIGVLASMIIAFSAYHSDRVIKVTEKPSLAEKEIKEAWSEAAPEQSLILQAVSRVDIELTKDTKAKVTLPMGAIATSVQATPSNEVVDEREVKTTKLTTARDAEINFSTGNPTIVPLPSGSKVTITEIPEVYLIAQWGLSLTKIDGEDGVTLLPDTRGYALLTKKLEFTVDVPEKTQATIQQDGGGLATVDVIKNTKAAVTLEKGTRIAVKFTTNTPALPVPMKKDQVKSEQTSDPPPAMLILPTLPACLASLATAAKDKQPIAEASAEACHAAATKGKADWLIDQYPRFINWSFWDVFQRALMVFATVVSTIFFREVRVDQNSWKPWSFKRIPFLRLISMSFTPALIGVFALSSAFVLQLTWASGLSLTQREVTSLFQDYWIYFAWHMLPCMTLSIGSLILMDKHDDWLVEVTICVGAFFSMILIALSLLIFYMQNGLGIGPTAFEFPAFLGGRPITQQALRDTILTAALPALFISLFAAFLELTEDNRGDQWLTMRILFQPMVHFKSFVGPRVFTTLLYLLGITALLLSFSAAATQAQAAPTDNGGVASERSLLTGGTPTDKTSNESRGKNSDTRSAKSENEPEKLLRIGVRSDARPFSYQSTRNQDVLTAATPGPLAQEKYTGFMVKICDAVLNHLLVNPIVPAKNDTPAVKLEPEDIEIVDVDALVAGNKGKSRFDYFGVEFDILCDPSTITNERRTRLILSPPLFLSGISFIDLPDQTKPKQEGCPDHPLIGLVGNTTAVSSGIRAVLDADELPKYRKLLIDWLNDGKSTCSKDKADYKTVKVFSSHSAAAKSFCNKEFYYYLGDQEIIAYNARQVPGCEFDQAGRTFTTDRYAIFGEINYGNPNRAIWVARFFEVLSQKVLFSPSILDTAFSDTFIGTEKSRALELFFWSVRGER